MKKIVLFLIIFIMIAACSTKNNFYDEHNAKSSLDWDGMYFGIIPCADCPGIEATLTLNNDNTYQLNLVYQERNVEPFVEQGTFEFDKSGNKITLFIDQKESGKYFVGENYLIQLDIDGNFIESELKDYYRLNKINKNSLGGYNWKVNMFNGKTLDSLSYFVKFDEKENRFSAYFGCNKIMGKVLIDNNGKCKFMDIVSTKMACPDNETELQLLDALEKVDNFVIYNDQLLLNKAKMSTIIKLIKE